MTRCRPTAQRLFTSAAAPQPLDASWSASSFKQTFLLSAMAVLFSPSAIVSQKRSSCSVQPPPLLHAPRKCRRRAADSGLSHALRSLEWADVAPTRRSGAQKYSLCLFLFDPPPPLRITICHPTPAAIVLLTSSLRILPCVVLLARHVHRHPLACFRFCPCVREGPLACVASNRLALCHCTARDGLIAIAPQPASSRSSNSTKPHARGTSTKPQPNLRYDDKGPIKSNLPPNREMRKSEPKRASERTPPHRRPLPPRLTSSLICLSSVHKGCVAAHARCSPFTHSTWRQETSASKNSTLN
jgi:hypothetical protein